jgi:hypothetical protein
MSEQWVKLLGIIVTTIITVAGILIASSEITPNNQGPLAAVVVIPIFGVFSIVCQGGGW